MQNVSYRSGKCRFNICPARFRSLFQSIGNSFFHKFVIRKIGDGDMSLARPFFIVFNGCFNGVLVARPIAPCNAAHNVPHHCGANDIIHAFAAVQNKAETAVDGFADSDTAAVVQRLMPLAALPAKH